MVDRRLDQIGVIPRRLVLIVPVPRGGAQLRIFPVRTAGEQTVHCARKLRPADRRAACGDGGTKSNIEKMEKNEKSC